MRALEFKSKIRNNQIFIPEQVQSELNVQQDKDVRVIVLVDDSDIYDDYSFQQATQKQFLKGYVASDSVYDDYNL